MQDTDLNDIYERLNRLVELMEQNNDKLQLIVNALGRMENKNTITISTVPRPLDYIPH